MMAKYEYIYRFDTDDIMVSNAVSTLYSYAKNKNVDMVLCHCKQMVTGKKPDKILLAHGQIFIKTETFIKYGGFQPVKCGADTELYKRIVKFAKVKIISNVCVLRRLHDNNLTVNNDTGMKSEYRKSIHAFIDYELKNWIKNEKSAIINCVTAPCFNIDTNEEILNDNPPTKSMYDKFMELPESIRKQYTPKKYNSYNYNTLTLNYPGYIRKRIQTSWAGL